MLAEVKADTSHRVKDPDGEKRTSDGGLHHRVAIGQPLLKNTVGPQPAVDSSVELFE